MSHTPTSRDPLQNSLPWSERGLGRSAALSSLSIATAIDCKRRLASHPDPRPSRLARVLQSIPRRSAALCAGALAVAPLVTGCVVAPAEPYAYGNTGAVVVSSQAPPPLRYEPAPVVVAPVATQIWIGGFWDWSGGRYVWREGRWAAPPHHGDRWVPREWVRSPHGWQARGGHWERR